MRRLTLILLSAGLLASLVAAPVAARPARSTIVDTAIAVNASSGEFDHLIAAVVRTGLVDTLDGRRQFTVFAPTDAAFESLFARLGVSGRRRHPARHPSRRPALPRRPGRALQRGRARQQPHPDPRARASSTRRSAPVCRMSTTPGSWPPTSTSRTASSTSSTRCCSRSHRVLPPSQHGRGYLPRPCFSCARHLRCVDARADAWTAGWPQRLALDDSGTQPRCVARRTHP